MTRSPGTETDILVVGAGPSGLAAALQLARYGVLQKSRDEHIFLCARAGTVQFKRTLATVHAEHGVDLAANRSVGRRDSRRRPFELKDECDGCATSAQPG